jgi:hypothetical protein
MSDKLGAYDPKHTKEPWNWADRISIIGKYVSELRTLSGDEVLHHSYWKPISPQDKSVLRAAPKLARVLYNLVDEFERLLDKQGGPEPPALIAAREALREAEVVEDDTY